MWKFGVVLFALMVFVMSLYYLISYVYGTVPHRTGIASIVGFMASASFFAYLGSRHGASHREDMIQTLFSPVRIVAENSTRGIINGIGMGAARSVTDGIATIAGTAAVGVTTLATTTMASFTALNFSAALASVLAGPLGVYVLPILAMLFSL